ncbi:MAG: cobaltochelatase subunit CobT, partial [Sphingomonas sp.]|nr:cobaltochelatase subunit CobT [Sphingomonas sp.]
MAERTPLDLFKDVLGGAARALSDEPEIELAFTADAPSQSGKHLKVPMPARALPAEQVAEARGFADGFALRLKHHDAALHLRAAPHEAVARAVFDAVETARVEALGSRGYAGIADNLATALDVRLRADPITRARTREEVPLSTALALMVRERLTGRESPALAAPGLALVREWIDDKAGADLDSLALALDDQRAFQSLARKLLEDLELVQGDELPEDTDDGESEEQGADDEQNSDEGQEEGEGGEGEAQIEARGDQREAEDQDGEGQEMSDDVQDMDGEPGDEGE